MALPNLLQLVGVGGAQPVFENAGDIPAPEPPDQMLDELEVIRYLGCTQAQFDARRTVDFPTAMTVGGGPIGTSTLTVKWSRRQIDRWAAEMQSKLPLIHALMGKKRPR